MSVIENFKEISKIPHCSFDTTALRDFLIEHCKSHAATVKVDEWGNIHAVKGSPKICLQSHYDMVCIGDAPKIEMCEENGFLRAKNSSLGADIGIGVSMMMDAIKTYENIECLFTNDEEVGMIGANNFSGKIIAKQLLNLDSECDSEVIIGCAGGVDIDIKMPNEIKKVSAKNAYKVEISGLTGGHSGVQIHENIPNAIKLLAKFLSENGCELVSVEGGERNNSIPTKASAVVLCDSELKSDIFKISSIGKKYKVLAKSAEILSFLNAFHQGVKKYDTNLNIVLDSINLSIIKTNENSVNALLFARSMSDDGLENVSFEISSLAKLAGFEVSFSDRSKAWKPENSEFANFVLSELKKYNENAFITAVHAGLECGVFKQNNENLQVCSIGPNIYAPHSINEKVELKSVETISKVVDSIVKNYQ